MKVVKPSYQILTPISDGGAEELKRIELVGRTCYKSESKIGEDTAAAFVGRLIKSGHEAMIEHSQLSVRFIVDRGVSHEIVRHRIASFAQESTRYCNYGSYSQWDDGQIGIVVVEPFFFEDGSKERKLWLKAMQQAENAYLELIIVHKRTPQEARCILPNSLKTEIVMTANYREWRNFFKLRTSKAAHPQIRQVAIPLLKELQGRLSVIFDDIIPEE